MIRWLTMDVFDGLATLEDGSIDLVVTSPPFLALRSYLPADHPDKAKEIGSEATPAAFLDVMLKVTAELGRVLAPHGSIAVELGDTYAGQFGEGHARSDGGRYPEGGAVSRPNQEPAFSMRPSRSSDGWPLAKSKTLIPELYRIALAYGFNPLTGEESPAGKWRVRNVVTWCRPNPPVGALGDKWRPATSDIVVACRSGKRFWDDLATRRAYSANSHPRVAVGAEGRHDLPSQQRDGNWNTLAQVNNDGAGAPLLDYWEIPPTGYAGAHYAVYPPALVEPLVKAMCPERVCRVCGEPSRRIVETEYEAHSPETIKRQHQMPRGQVASTPGTKVLGVGESFKYGRASRIDSTKGFTDCGHDDFRPGRVLDPFAGSGTTLAVASGHGHDAIGIDLDERNRELARASVSAR